MDIVRCSTVVLSVYYRINNKCVRETLRATLYPASATAVKFVDLLCLPNATCSKGKIQIHEIMIMADI